MALRDIHAETAAKLAVLHGDTSLRKLAVQLGYPAKRAAFLCDVLHGRTDNYSLKSLYDLRLRLGLAKPLRQRPPCWRPYVPARHRAALEPLITAWLAAQDEPSPPAWVNEAAGWLHARLEKQP